MPKSELSLVRIVNFRLNMNDIIEDSKTSKFSIVHSRDSPIDEISTIWNISVTIECCLDPLDEELIIERSVTIGLVPLTAIPFDFTYHVSILDLDGTEIFISEFFEFKGAAIEVGKALNGGIKVDKLKDDCLNIRFVIIKKDSVAPETKLSDEKQYEVNKPHNDLFADYFKDDFKRLFNDMEDSDIDLITNGIAIPAHKLILCTRSPEFKKKIHGKLNSTNTSANESSICNIDAFDFEDAFSPAVMKEFVRFCYYSEVEFDNLTKGYHTVELYNLAEEFKVKGLAELSLKFINEAVHGFVLDDIVEVMELADTCGAEDLFNRSVTIFFANYVKNSKCGSWMKVKVELKLKIFDKIVRMSLKNMEVDVFKV